jgi:hypothetical protein
MTDRRSRNRFPIEREVRWRRRSPRRLESRPYETASSVDLASHGLHVAAFGPRPPAHTRIEASIDWPCSLNGTPLQLCVTGHVVRETPQGFVMTIDEYEFRTKARAASSVA